MVQSCCAYNCTERATLNTGYSFHRFPLHNEDLLKEWCLAVRRKNFEPQKYSRICSKHFTDDSYEPGLKFRKLKSNAIPTIFDFGKSKPHQRKSKARRHDSATVASYKRFISSKQSTENFRDDEKIETASSTSENESDQEERVVEIIKLTNYQNNGPPREYNNTDSEISNDCDKDYVGGLRSASSETNSNNDDVQQYDTSKMSQQKQNENEKLRQTILLLHKRLEKFVFLVGCLQSTDMISEEAAFVLRSTMDM